MNPCDNCQHAKTCGRNRWACYAFALYVNDGMVRAEEEVPRNPNRDVYARVMWFDDDTLIRQINRGLRTGVFHVN